jgi:O-antigen/teichoic acid export membrane protein
MDKALKMGRESASGSFHLFTGKIVSTVILAIETIILGIFLTESEYGLYAVAFIPIATILLFQDWGISSALTKYCAQCKAKGDKAYLRKIIKVGVGFELATGILLAITSYLMANFLASTVFGKPEASSLIAIISTTVLSGPLLVTAQAIFVGFERMKLSSVTMICQAVFICVLAPLLVLMGYGALGAVLGYAFAMALAAAVALIILYFAEFRKLSGDPNSKPATSEDLKTLLRFGVPLAISTMIGSMLAQFTSFIMASAVDLEMIGNYRIATNFVVLLTFVTVPIATVLFPTFSKIDPRNETSLLKTIFDSSVKYTILFLIPATMGLMVLSGPIVGTLYGDKWSYAPLFLTLYPITNLWAISGLISVNNVLTAFGETKLLMKISMLGASIGIPLAFLLIPQFGIIGLIAVSLTAGVPGMLIKLRWTWKRYGIKANFQVSARIFLASAISATLTYIVLNLLGSIYWIELVVGAMVFLISYLVAAPLLGAVTETDVNNLRAMFSDLRIISKVLELPLRIMEKPIKMQASRSSVKNSN